MTRARLLLTFLAFAAPLAAGHDTQLPDPTCSGAQAVHHYVGYAGEYEGTANGHEASGTGFVVDGNRDDCLLDGTYADHDGEYEFGYGAAVLASMENPLYGRGSIACLGAAPHHVAGSTVTVTDAHAVVSGPVLFAVAADHGVAPDVLPPDCGDGVIEPTVNPYDKVVHCLDSCQIPFLPGADGAYWVFLETSPAVTIPTWGHIETAAEYEGWIMEPTPLKGPPLMRSYEDHYVWPCCWGCC